jgi:alpha,alpha-trehalose phosphorylase
MDHLVEGPDDILIRTEALPDLARLTVACELPAGSRLRLVKLIAYGWSAQRSLPALRDEVAAALAAAGQTGWEALRNDQRAYLDDYWMRADVLVEGDAALQQAVRFGLFHVLQAGARAERRSIPTKGLTGTGYDGHCFWDTERFVLPVLTHTNPSATEDALRWRHDTMPLAEQRAEQLGLSGAAFPWRTINGQECSGYWPAGTAAFHVNADIADAVVRYVDATGNHAFERRTGLPLLVQTARLWRSLGHHDVDGAFRIDGVTGPDEYSALADNNVYTNLMAQRNLTAAAAAVERHPSRARQLHVTDDEIASWRIAATAMVVPYDERLGVHPQARASPGTSAGTSTSTGPTATRCCCTPPTSSCTASRWSSRPTWSSPSSCTPPPSPTNKSDGTSTTTNRSPSGTLRCRHAPRPWSQPRSATSTSRTTMPSRRR